MANFRRLSQMPSTPDLLYAIINSQGAMPLPDGPDSGLPPWIDDSHRPTRAQEQIIRNPYTPPPPPSPQPMVSKSPVSPRDAAGLIKALSENPELMKGDGPLQDLIGQLLMASLSPPTEVPPGTATINRGAGTEGSPLTKAAGEATRAAGGVLPGGEYTVPVGRGAASALAAQGGATRQSASGYVPKTPSAGDTKVNVARDQAFLQEVSERLKPSSKLTDEQIEAIASVAEKVKAAGLEVPDKVEKFLSRRQGESKGPSILERMFAALGKSAPLAAKT